MDILFIDESEQINKEQKSHFVLLGTIVSSEKLIPLERYIFRIREKYKLDNLKKLRTDRNIQPNQRLDISKELYDGLQDFNVTLISSIIGSLSMRKYSKIFNYREAMTFIIERFYFYLHHNNKEGMIILDSNTKDITKPIRKEIYEYILSEEKREGKIRKRIYGPVFFCEDQFSHVIQLSDLCVAGLQRATWEMLKKIENSNDLKGREDELFQYNPFIQMYWKYFLTYRGRVSGAGIKYWN